MKSILIVIVFLSFVGCAGTPPSQPQPEPQPVMVITMKVIAPNTDWCLKIRNVLEFADTLWVTAVLERKQPKSSSAPPHPVRLKDVVLVHAHKLPLQTYVFTSLSEEEFVRLGNERETYVAKNSFLNTARKFKLLQVIREGVLRQARKRAFCGLAQGVAGYDRASQDTKSRS